MDKTISSLPCDLREFREDPPEGWRISRQILDPSLWLAKSGKYISLELRAKHFVQGEAQYLSAPTLRHNWVADQNTIAPLPHDVPEVLDDLLDGVNPDALTFNNVIALKNREEPPITIEIDDAIFHAGIEIAKHLDRKLETPGLEGILYPYQAQGVSWMRDTIRYTGGLILADEMGLGKTIQIISLLLIEPNETQTPALVVCPSSLLANWEREIFRFAPDISVLIHHGSSRSGNYRELKHPQVVITTYETLVNDQVLFRAFKWSWLVCDEAQALKNPDSQRRQVVAKVSRTRMISMTGTPVETSLVDLWSLVDLAIPDLLGDRGYFEARYPDAQESARELSRITGPIILRRRVLDVAQDLPDRIDTDIPITLGTALSTQYNSILSETLAEYPRNGALVATGRLQMFCAHPWLQGLNDGPDPRGDGGLAEAEDPSTLLTPKLDRTAEILKESFGNRSKVLVFVLFNRCYELIRRSVDPFPGVFWGQINGSVPQPERQPIIDEFTEHEGPGCLILNPKAAGTGLNITAATIVIHYTQYWNPATESQASARAHRRGQTQPVYVYRLFYKNTLEEIMIERAEWRREMGNEAVPVSVRDNTDLQKILTTTPMETNGNNHI